MNSAREQSTSEGERLRCYLQQEIFTDKKKKMSQSDASDGI